MGNPLIAFALVAEEYESSGDPIRGLYPLFAPLLQDSREKRFDPEEFSKRFQKTYGLEMTPFVASALRGVLVQIGLLKEIKIGTYDVINFEWSQDEIDERKIGEVSELFSRWASKQLEKSDRKYKSEELENAFLVRLARPEFSSIFLDEDIDKKSERLKGMLGMAAVDPSANDDVYLDYLVADFTLKAYESAPEIFNSLVKISYGSLLADAVVGLAAPVRSVMPDPALRVVVDSPLVMDLLDLNTEEHKKYATGLIQIMKEAGIRLAVFDHSIDEIRVTVRSTLQAYANGEAYGPLAERLRRSPGHKLYAISTMDSLEKGIEDLGISILRSEFYEEARYKKYFNDEHFDRIRNAIGDLHEHIDARIWDAKSVATVARLKQDKRYAESIFNAGTIFVTRNSMLVKRVNKVLSIGRGLPDPRFTIVTDGQIAGILWFVHGIGSGVEISRERLIANCSAAVLPKNEVVTRISKQLDGISPELGEQFEALMRDRRASMCPMRLAGWAGDSIDEDLSLEVLKTMKNELAADSRKQIEEARNKIAEQDRLIAENENNRKELVSSLQGAVEGSEKLRQSSQLRFDSQLAQLSFELNQSKAREKEERKSKNRKLSTLRDRIRSESDLLSSKINRLKILFEFIITIIFIIPSLLAILYPSYSPLWFRVTLAVIFVFTVSFVARWGNSQLSILSKAFFKKRLKYIQDLQYELDED